MKSLLAFLVMGSLSLTATASSLGYECTLYNTFTGSGSYGSVNVQNRQIISVGTDKKMKVMNHENASDFKLSKGVDEIYYVTAALDSSGAIEIFIQNTSFFMASGLGKASLSREDGLTLQCK